MEMDSNSTPGLEGEVQTLRLEVNKLMATVSTLQEQQTKTSKTQGTEKLIGVLNKFVTHRTYQIRDQKLALELEEKMCEEVISLCSTTATKFTRTEEPQPQSQQLVEVDDDDDEEEFEGNEEIQVKQLGGTVEVGTTVTLKPEKSLLGYLGRVSDTDLVKPTSEVAGKIVEAIKSACSSVAKPDAHQPLSSGESNLYEDCFSVARSFPNCFTHTDVVDLLVNMVRSCNRNGGQSANMKSGVFAINLLTSAFQDEEYPLAVVEMFMEDAFEGRHWVDQTHCSQFVENLRTYFGTKPSFDDLLWGWGLKDSVDPSRKDFEPSDNDLTTALKKHNDQKTTSPACSRYNRKEAEVGNMIVNFATEAMQKAGSDSPGLPEVSKNLLQALSFACGLLPVRVFVLSHLEKWLDSPKCSRQAQQLLLSLCLNSNSNSNVDAEVVVNISKLRIKFKPEFFCFAIRQLVNGNEENMRNVVAQVMYNELSLTRNPNNLMILGTIVPSSADAFGIFAEVILDMLQKKDDLYPAIRQILRQVQHTSRHDSTLAYECSLVPFVKGLFFRVEEISWPDPKVRARAFKSITDLVLFSMFLSYPVRVMVVAKIQDEALRWLYQVVPKVYQPSKKDYIASYDKLLLKNPGTELQSTDGFPSEGQRAAFAKLCAGIPLSGRSIMSLLFHFLNSENLNQQNLTNLTHDEILDYTEYLIMKAAAANCLLPMEEVEIIDSLLLVSQYKQPEGCELLAGYEPPKLAITKNYWRVWILLVVLSSNNPNTLGKIGFKSYPTLRALMEMCMTNRFSFPTLSSPSMEEIMAKERELVAKERQTILEFEENLAPAAVLSSKKNNIVTEENSLLLSHVMSLDPLGPCRCPPPTVLTHLESLNERLCLGVKLSNSRNANFFELGRTQTTGGQNEDQGRGHPERTGGKPRSSSGVPPKSAKRKK